MFKSNGFLTTENILKYDAIANYYMRKQTSLAWQIALKSATASIKSELSSRILFMSMSLSFFFTKNAFIELTDAQKTLVCPGASGQPDRQINLAPLITMQALQAAMIKVSN
jgi:hypothetical protein